MSDKTGSKTAAKIRQKSEKAARQEVLSRKKKDDKGKAEEGAEGEVYKFMDEQYPTDAYTAFDKRDEKMDMIMKLQVEQGETGVTPYGAIEANPDELYDYLKRKRDADVVRGFEQWFAMNFDHMSPAQKAMARKMYPNFYKSRLRVLKKNVKLLEDLARIRLMGIQSKEDLFLKYAADNGLIDTRGIENILHPTRPGPPEFVRGMLNSKVWHPVYSGQPPKDNAAHFNNGRGYRTQTGDLSDEPTPAWSTDKLKEWGILPNE